MKIQSMKKFVVHFFLYSTIKAHLLCRLMLAAGSFTGINALTINYKQHCSNGENFNCSGGVFSDSNCSPVVYVFD